MTAPRAVVLVLAALLVACGGDSAPLPATSGEPTLDSAVGTDAGTEPTAVPVDEVVSRFVASVSPAFRADRRMVDEAYPLSPDGPLPGRIEAWSVAEDDAAPPLSDLRLRFSLRIFDFGSVDEAAEAVAGLTATADDSMLLKSPLLAVRVGSSVLRLDGACSFSRARWLEVQDALIRALPPDGAAGGVLEILCGGSVVRTPGSGPPGGGRRQDPADDGVNE